MDRIAYKLSSRVPKLGGRVLLRIKKLQENIEDQWKMLNMNNIICRKTDKYYLCMKYELI